jgi:hypothetical protein
MTKNGNMRRYTSEELRELRRNGASQTNWDKVDSITEEELGRLIAEDGDEADLEPDLSKAQIGIPGTKSNQT